MSSVDPAPPGPTHGAPSGRHRAAEPPGRFPVVASRLDPAPDLWDGELRVDLEMLVLDHDELADLGRVTADEPGARRAALLEITAERGGLSPRLGRTIAIGRVAASATQTWSVTLGDQVAIAGPAASVPMWLADVSRWDGRQRTVPATGHAIVAAATPLVRVDPAHPPLLTAELVRAAHVPAVVAAVTERGPIAVLGATTSVGAVAVAVARDRGARVLTVVATLQDVRLARALGADDAVIADVTDPVDVSRALADAGAGPAAATVVASERRGAASAAVTATEPGGAVVLLTRADEVEAAATLAASLGADQDFRVPAPMPTDEGRVVHELVATHPALAELLRWRAGTGPVPTATRPEDT